MDKQSELHIDRRPKTPNISHKPVRWVTVNKAVTPPPVGGEDLSSGENSELIPAAQTIPRKAGVWYRESGNGDG